MENQSPSDEAGSILVDDDPLVRLFWGKAARIAGKKLRIFQSSQELREALPEISTKTLLYIDFDLKESATGAEFAKWLFEKGFQKIFLVTGYPPDQFGELPWITKVLGKDPPF